MSVDAQVLNALRTLDSCTVSNAVERLDVRPRTEGFIAGATRCRFPKLPPMVGYAATARIRTSSPPIAHRCYYDRMDWWNYVASLPEPRVVVLQDADHQPGAGAFVGEIHATIGRALNCIGCVTNGAVRDLPAVEKMGFQLFAGSVCVSHSYAHIIEFGEPVEIDGLKIASGDLLHGDRHGVLSIPLSIASRIPAEAARIVAEERELIDLLQIHGVFAERISPADSEHEWELRCSMEASMKLPPANRCEAWSVGPLPLVTALYGIGSASALEEPRLKGPANRPYFTKTLAAALVGCVLLCSCGRDAKVQAKDPGVVASEVGVIKVGRKDLGRSLTLSSELVPFQEIDVYAKESGYIKELNVDYGSHVTANQTLAILEIPELQAQLRQDDAAIKNASDQIGHAQKELSRIEAQHDVLKAYYDRLDGVAKSKPGLVAQQEIEEAHSKDLATEAQVEGAKTSVASAESMLAQAQAKREHDQVLFDYSKITAPFAGVVTQRFANLGALVQAGTSSSTQAMPIVRLSEDDKFRLVIPVPESYVHAIRIGDPVSVMVPSLSRTFPGTIARFAVDVREDTRTMHTEVDVLNPGRTLLAGMYAQATITVERKQNSIAVPIQAVSQQGDRATVLIVTPSNKIEIRPVTLGIQTATDAEILSGLEEGETLVVSDRSGLKAGQDVKPKTVELLHYSEK